jgi:hypothetical protein
MHLLEVVTAAVAVAALLVGKCHTSEVNTCVRAIQTLSRQHVSSSTTMQGKRHDPHGQLRCHCQPVHVQTSRHPQKHSRVSATDT